MDALEEAIRRAHERLEGDLTKVQPGGVARDVDALQGVRVQVVKKGAGGSGRLGEVAEVVPRGKSVEVRVGGKEHVKAIISALNQPPHNLNPQASPTDPLVLSIPLPPVTQESRAEAAKVAGQYGEVALMALKEARAAHKKKLQKLFVGKMIGREELPRVEKEMEKVNEGAVARAKKMVEVVQKRVLGS